MDGKKKDQPASTTVIARRAQPDVAIPSILLGLPLVDTARFWGLPRPYGPRNDVFFFRLLSGAALAHSARRNAGDGVPYGK